MARRSWILAAAAFLAAAVGCGQPKPADELPKSLPLSMKGKVAPELVGNWKYVDGTYSFSKDGTYDVHFDYYRGAGPGQPNKHVEGHDRGHWSADPEYVYFKSADGHVIADRYKFSEHWSELALYAKYAKIPESLRRLKA